jgi:hypothetical protein
MNKERMTGQTERMGRTWRENEYTCVKLVLTVFRAPNRKRERQSFMEARDGSVKFLNKLRQITFRFSVLQLKCNLV